MLKLLKIDLFTALLLLMVILASIVPISGSYADYFGHLTTIAIAILFFLHGVKIPRQVMKEGILHWKLHSFILAITFIFFPLIGLALQPILQPLWGQSLYYGFLFLCFLPSTVQSSISFTSIAQGNVAGAVCSASFSNILGMLITPILVGLFIQSSSESTMMGDSIVKIVLLLLVPFILGQMVQGHCSDLLKKQPKLVKAFDQGTILMVVYGAFSGAVVSGIWSQIGLTTLLSLLLVCCLLLAVVMIVSYSVAKSCGFNEADCKTIFFCSSKKTLASGVPMAQILFIGQPLGMLILPIMIFHQIQLIVCAVIANRWAKNNV